MGIIGGMERDRSGLRVLDRDECFVLLRSVPVVRIGLAINGTPVVLPVNFGLVDDTVVFRSAIGTKLDSAIVSDVVAVEADGYDAADRTGWSVVIKGRARELTSTDEIARASALSLYPWGIDHADHFVGVRADLVSGRCIGTPAELSPPVADAADPRSAP
jgi:hypothetical protein